MLIRKLGNDNQPKMKYLYTNTLLKMELALLHTDPPHVRDNLTEYKKKSFLNLAKTLQCKVWHAKSKVWLLIKMSLYTAFFPQDLFRNFGLCLTWHGKNLAVQVTLR